MVNAWFSGSFLPSSIRLVGRSLVLRPTFPPTPFPSVTSWDEWRVWVKDGGRNEDPTEAIRSEGNVRRWHTVNGIGYAWSLVVWCRVISSHRSLPLHCRLGSVRSLTTFLSLTSPYSSLPRRCFVSRVPLFTQPLREEGVRWGNVKRPNRTSDERRGRAVWEKGGSFPPYVRHDRRLSLTQLAGVGS